MPVDHRERAFETAIEHSLLTRGGYVKADPAGFDRVRALDPTAVLSFIQATQPREWAALAAIHKDDAGKTLLDDLCRALEDPNRGMLDVLRHGFKCFGKTFRTAYFKPASALNPDTAALYAANRLTVTRQLHYSIAHENSIDLVLSVNGLPLVTAEIKNPMTGQTIEHAKHQYRHDRDPRDRIFAFKQRALVHFALDPELAAMTTRLSGKSTHFLPFNRGDGNGAGNPENSGGYRTAYVWEEVWRRDSLMELLQRFLHLEVEETTLGGKKVRRETMIFPRYHQLHSVRRLEAAARTEGPGHNYLIQHSAGSGKSNSIAWLAHRLASLHDASDAKVFDSVVVVTDRRVLDQQLQNTIYQFEHRAGVVQKIDEDSGQLAEALKSGVPIIVTTLQKFPFVAEKVGALPNRRYAVIVDEAHSSQSGEAAAELRGVLAAGQVQEQARREAEEEGLPDYEEEILRTVMRRGHQPNLSFFAFTATPKYRTLEVFGRNGDNGKPEPFHLYSMRQAIEENFILDVLQNYVTYKTYYRLVKAAAEDPEVDKRKAARALARFMSLHPHNIAQKTEVMIEHFRQVTRHKIGGLAKAMLVTGSRLHAVRYKQAFDKYIAEKGYTGIRTLVAFSGTVEDPDVAGASYTEPGMNKGIGLKELPKRFAGEEFQVLIVAEKYQTGFDQPLLHTMYVDKRLDGVQAVQTLSRLNRTAPGKEDTFVLDFVNEAEQVREAFQPYYERTLVGERAEVAQLYELQAKLAAEQVYYPDDVEAFCQVYFKPKADQSAADHAALNARLDPAVGRFSQLDPDRREEFRSLLVAFRNLYAFLSQIIPFQDTDLEKLYTYIRLLLPKLPRGLRGPEYDFEDDITLKYYRLQKISEGSIVMERKGGYVAGPTAVGTSALQEPKVPLSRLIDLVNERFGTDFKPADELFWESVREDGSARPDLRQIALANSFENFQLVLKKELEGLVIDRMEQNQEMAARFLNDPAVRALIEAELGRRMYEQIRTPGQPTEGSGTPQ
jgi:type I restriction enzyme R subunit